MAQTKSGAKRTAQTNRDKYGADFYSRIGAMGGKHKYPGKGFAGMSPEKRSAAGRLGGKNSRRRKTQ